MEVEGITIVRTPLTQYIYDTEGMEGLRRLDARLSGILIQPERGVPQGDTGSPLIWLAVYDILLRALTIQRQQLNDRLAHAINYADDLKSVARNLGSLQQQANLVSAFALVFGLDQSKMKFRAFRFPFDVPMDQRDQILPVEEEIHKKRLANGYSKRTTPWHAERSWILFGYGSGRGPSIQGDSTAAHDSIRSHEV